MIIVYTSNNTARNLKVMIVIYQYSEPFLNFTYVRKTCGTNKTGKMIAIVGKFFFWTNGNKYFIEKLRNDDDKIIIWLLNGWNDKGTYQNE